MNYKILPLIVLLILNTKLAFTQCNTADWTALKALYENTNGDNWTDKTGWDIIKLESPPDDCNLENLYGIYVDENGSVSCIDLDGIDDCNYNFEATGNNLTGIIPAEIGELASLITLNLAINQITGNIPSEISNLSNLRSLDLGGNLLEGNIPIELGDLNNLMNLLLNSNQLSGNLPVEFGKLSNLNYLALYDNALTGSIPVEIGDLLNLEVLQLSFNQLTGSLPPEIGKLSNLYWIEANSNELSGEIPPEIGDLQNLYYLDLNYNKFNGSLPAEIGDLAKLEFLIIHSNKLSGEIPAELSQLSILKVLDLSYNKLSGVIPFEIGSLQNLIELEIGPNELSGAIPSSLGNLTNLTTLTLWLNNLSGCYPDSIYLFCSQIDTSNDSFDYIASGNNFAASWDEFCANKTGICSEAKCDNNDWTALKALYENTNGSNWNNNTGWVEIIENNDIHPDSCDLSQLWGIQLDVFGRASAIDLGTNNLTGTIPGEINKLDSLVSLNLNHNTLAGDFPLQITELGNLERLNLEGIGLENEIPTEIENLKKLTILNLSDNQLTGEIPAEIGTLEPLTEIQLNNNLLTGSIPESLSDLSKLKFLEIAHNNLSGCYPFYLKKLCNENYDGDTFISNGNNFDSTWDAFCTTQAGICEQTEPCDKDVWEALKALYENTHGENWTENGGWDTMFENETEPPAYCDFNILYGVDSYPDIFNTDNQIYLEIELKDNQLCGNIPNEILALNNLSILDLRSNKLIGSIPGKSTSTDSYLYYINLSNNLLTDIIPANIINHKNLRTIDFSYNDLTGNIPTELSQLENLDYLNLNDNQLSNSIPLDIVNLSTLKGLNLSSNLLDGSIPRNLNKLTYLNYLNLSHNQLSDEIPFEIGKLDSLEVLYLNDNQLNGEIPVELFDLSKLYDLRLSNNKLRGNIPTQIENLVNLETLILYNNQLSEDIPAELGYLKKLRDINFQGNQLSGSIPVELGDLNNLFVLNLSYNELSGTIPKFQSDIWAMYLEHNRFSCKDIETHFNNNPHLDDVFYSPQYFKPSNYDSIELNIIDSLQYDNAFELSVELPEINSTDLTYQWVRNEYEIPNTNQANYQVENILSGIAGRYTVHINQNDCAFSRGALELISDPMYVILKGYDLYGQPVEYDQIMVQFENPSATIENEDEILTTNAGWVKKACNCNRELYLWEFPGTEDAAKALVEIDKKEINLKKKSNIDGGFNNLLKVGNINNTQKAFTIKNDSLSNDNSDSATIFILDSGLDHQNSDTLFLFNNAPIDICYGIEGASGYAYTDTTSDNISDTIPLSTNYQDDLWHGTYGFRSITADLKESHNIKIVPLKIFNENGQGNLFNLTCALYHAIDHEADVINISAGYSGQPSSILERAILLAKEKEIFITAAAGNDAINIDSLPQYPAYYAGKYYSFKTADDSENTPSDSIKFDHVISVVSIDENNSISQFSNFGKQSATLAAYGERIHGSGLGDSDVVASGTSMATYFVTKELALEIASNRNRTQEEIWNDFEENHMLGNNSIETLTSTGKQLKVQLVDAVIYGCTDPNSCNYFEYVTIEDGTCEYNSCKCVQADWVALKALYEKTEGDNWKRNSNWETLKLNAIPPNCNFENLYGVQLNNNGRVAEINLYNNNLNGNIPVAIKSLTELNSLYLAANNLSGSIPAELSELIHLKNLILSANNLSGPIPFQLGELTNLSRLYLSYNKLNGEIPTQLNQLNDLKYFLLDNNELVGKLPAELALLSNLYLLNISNNELSGCYENDLTLLCNQFWSTHFKGNANISDGNYFDEAWENFCSNAEGVCLNNKESNVELNELNVYPNPSRGRFIVEILNTDNKSRIFNILNLEGKQLLQIQGRALGDNLFEIDLSEFSKGMYFLEMKTNSNKHVQKLILD